MEMPPVHLCVFLTDEHGRLRKKIVELKNQITQLEHTVRERNLDQSRSCSISCQTDLAIQLRPIPSAPPTIRVPSRDEQELHRLVTAQNELLKKYEYESLQRRQQQPPSASSPLPSNVIGEFERRLAQCEKHKVHAERRAKATQQRLRKAESRFDQMRKKMSVLDDGFFEEVDDLKFAVQQATHLNNEYEKTIQMLSARLGIVYPVDGT